MVQKIGMFILVTFAIIALVKEPETVASFITAIGDALRTVIHALGDLFNSVST
jgi:hypothetical protein